MFLLCIPSPNVKIKSNDIGKQEWSPCRQSKINNQEQIDPSSSEVGSCSAVVAKYKEVGTTLKKHDELVVNAGQRWKMFPGVTSVIRRTIQYGNNKMIPVTIAAPQYDSVTHKALGTTEPKQWKRQACLSRCITVRPASVRNWRGRRNVKGLKPEARKFL